MEEMQNLAARNKIILKISIAIVIIAVCNLFYQEIISIEKDIARGIILLVIVIFLFIVNRIWLVRLTGYFSIFYCFLLPFGIFPIFGYEKNDNIINQPINQLIMIFLAQEILFLSIGWILLRIANAKA